MDFKTEFRNKIHVQSALKEMCKLITRSWIIMEICGGQTHAIMQYGLDELLPKDIEIVHGPGCPVCVTPLELVDKAITIATQPEVIFTSFGDMLRVPGSDKDLFAVRAAGGDVRVVLSPLDAVQIAHEHPEEQVVLFAIGFETTAPASAFAIREAMRQNLANFFLFSAHKVMPPALRALVDEELRIDGFIAPGHVSSITGTGIYRFLPEEYGKGVVVSGFEPMDMMLSVLGLVKMFESGPPAVENQYKRVVKNEGNRKALDLLDEVFEPSDDLWRGLGMIPLSGLQLQSTFQQHDARIHFKVPEMESTEPKGCICGEILKGLKRPAECPLFRNVCTPDNPVGACMVSGEGSCAIAYKYTRH
ncbi:MAG: hydrogenase formation protein HypD [Bacteroidetes bacterium]|nr:MAG: hydrogenase formation protein HypD [Bacteroidota bacterium]